MQIADLSIDPAPGISICIEREMKEWVGGGGEGEAASWQGV